MAHQVVSTSVAKAMKNPSIVISARDPHFTIGLGADAAPRVSVEENT